MTPGLPQLSTWSAAKPCSRSTAGPEPCAVYAIRVPSNERTCSMCISSWSGAPARHGGIVPSRNELGAERVEVERVGVGHGEQRDAPERPDEQRRLRGGVDVAPDLAAFDSLEDVVLDHRADVAVDPVDRGEERGLGTERFTEEHARGADLELGTTQAVHIDPQPDEQRGQPLALLERGLEQPGAEPLYEVVRHREDQALLEPNR